MATQVHVSKTISETIDVQCDMLSRIVPGETIVTAACAVVVFAGTDPTPSNMLVGLPSISNNVVKQQITGGLPGVIYMLNVSARSSLNNIVINEIKLAVLSDNAVVPA